MASMREKLSLPESKNVINMKRHYNHRRKLPHAHHNTDLHTIKAYYTRPVNLTIEVLLIMILFFDHRSIHLFQSNQSFQTIGFVDLLWKIKE